MKKFYYILFLLLPLLAMVGCTDESLYDGEGDQVTLSYSVKLDDEGKSRAIGDGSNIDQLLVGIFTKNGEQLVPLIQEEFTVSENKANVTLQLLKNQEYQLVFWAQTKDNGIYNTSDLSNITIDYSNFQKTQAEAAQLDAFYATSKVKVTTSTSDGGSITLKRPFTQFGIGVYGSDVEVKSIESAQIKVTGTLYTGFKPLAEGEKAVAGNANEYTFNFTELNDKRNSFIINDKTYTLLTTNYFLVPTEETDATISGSVSLKDGNGDSVSEFQFTDAPLVLNARLNLGKGLTEVWDGVIVEALPEADGNGIIHIENTQQLAYLMKYGVTGTVESPKKIHLCKDLDMNGTVIPRAADYAIQYVSFDGGGKTLYRLGTSLFGKASNVDITGLNIQGADINKDDGHVGVLADTLCGNSTLQDITINSSSALSKNGAAGGMVGYIVRSSETDRSKTLTVTFNNCDLVGVTANGTQSEGKFVGLLSGYDNGEILAFDEDCSADENTSVSDYLSSYIVENQSVWAKKDANGNDITIDDKYDGWLGTETYRRGKVLFEGKRLVPKWDGNTTVEPLLANTNYDINVTAAANKYVVYSPYDLAGVRTKTASPAAIYLRADIDMNGQGADGEFNVPSNFTQSACSSTDDNVFDPFSYVTTLDGKKSDTENYSIHNLSIAQIEQERAAFILYASGTTSHKNINFRNCQTVAVHKPVTTDAKAYGAILVSNVDATYTMENVHAYDCKVFALQKVGTLGARINGTSTLKNNSVNNCYVENYECNISEYFTSGDRDIAGYLVDCHENFFPHGEVGGMFGFIQGNSSISNCNVNSTRIYGFGQNDKKAKFTIKDKNGKELSWILQGLANIAVNATGLYLIPGRHVSTFIGDIRATGAITIANSGSTGSQCLNRQDKHNNTYDYLGQCYYVRFLDNMGSVTVDGKALTLADCNSNTKR